MIEEERDFPEIGIIERYFRKMNASGTRLSDTKRSSPKMAVFKDGHFSVTYLVWSFLCPDRKMTELSRVDFFSRTPEEALSEAFLCLNSWFSNPHEFFSWEELDLFLSSEGF